MKKRLVAILLMGLAASADAAEFVSSRWGEHLVIVVTGKILPGDDAKMDAAIGDAKAGMVLLNSRGGDIKAGVGIGRAIRKRGFGSWVSSQQGDCTSACAFAWLGGAPRMMDPDARIGFHPASWVNRGKVEVSAPGNGLLGAYMRDLGLPDNVILHTLAVSPESLIWLTPRDARMIGLDVEYIEKVAAPK